MPYIFSTIRDRFQFLHFFKQTVNITEEKFKYFSENPFYIYLILCVSVSLVYLPAIGFNFLLYDDPIHVYENPLVLKPWVSNMDDIWTRPYQRLYIPLSYTVWAALAALSRLVFFGNITPFLFHLANFLLHIVNSFLIFSILKVIFQQYDKEQVSYSRQQLAGLFGALFFGLHPIQVEAIAWVTGMKGLLAAFFSLLSIRLFLVTVVKKNKNRTIYLFYHTAALVAFSSALLSKPSAIVVPGVLVFLLWGSRQLTASKVKYLVPWVGIAIICAVWTKIIQPAESLSYDFSIFERILIAADAIWFYVVKIVAPFGLIVDFGRTPQAVLEVKWVYIYLIIEFVVLFFLFFSSHRRILLMCFGVFIIGILPILGLIPFDHQRISTTASRYLYLSMLGPALVIGIITCQKKNHLAILFLIITMLGYGVLTRYHIRYWRDTETLMKWTLRYNPKSYTANLNLGVVLMRQGETANAIPYVEKALSVNSGSVLARYNLAIAYASVNDTRSANQQQEALALIDPPSAEYLKKVIPLIVESVKLGKLDSDLKKFILNKKAVERTNNRYPGKKD